MIKTSGKWLRGIWIPAEEQKMVYVKKKDRIEEKPKDKLKEAIKRYKDLKAEYIQSKEHLLDIIEKE